MERGKHIDIPIGLLETNDGQIPGLATNPRDITDKDFRALKKNLKDVPRMLDARALIVYPLCDKYVVIGGNQRLRALREEKDRDSVPCFVLPSDTTSEEMQAMTILDNTQRGAWNWDALANEWNAAKLQGWGVPAWGDPAPAEPELPSANDTREAANYGEAKMVFQFDADEFDFVSGALARINVNKENALLELLGYGKAAEEE